MMLALLALAHAAEPPDEASAPETSAPPEGSSGAAAAPSEALARHAARHSWSAVDHAYRTLLEEGEPTPGDHLLGGEAALELGDPLLAWHRLRRLPPPPSDPPPPPWSSAQALIEALQTRYGRVAISVPVDAPAGPLERPHLPFAKVERSAIAAARDRLGTHHSFRGLLPEGRYTLGATTFDVEADWSRWQVVIPEALPVAGAAIEAAPLHLPAPETSDAAEAPPADPQAAADR